MGDQTKHIGFFNHSLNRITIKFLNTSNVSFCNFPFSDAFAVKLSLGVEGPECDDLPVEVEDAELLF